MNLTRIFGIGMTVGFGLTMVLGIATKNTGLCAISFWAIAVGIILWIEGNSNGSS